MCVLNQNNGQYNAATGAAVTVCVVAGATTLVSATYNGAPAQVNGNCTTFTVVAGTAVLYITLAGPQDDVQIVEDCGGGETQVLFAYQHDYHPILGFAIVGA